MGEIARILIGAGVLLILVGGALLIFGKVPWIGRLPGDILVKKENFTFYFPVTTSILLSLALSVMWYLWNRK